jgi:hypothetical protein
MPHFKRHRSKNCRAGCLLCKRWKVDGFNSKNADAQRFSDFRRQVDAQQQIAGASS